MPWRLVKPEPPVLSWLWLGLVVIAGAVGSDPSWTQTFLIIWSVNFTAAWLARLMFYGRTPD